MKKLLIIIGIILVVLIASAAVLPVIFKDDIRQAIDKQIAASVNAEVYYDTDNLRLSLFKSFPDITLSMRDFGVIGEEIFSEDTLLSVKSFSLTVDPVKIISGNQIKVVSILLDSPQILVLVMEDGTANYDIMVEMEEEEEITEEEESEDFSVGIENWEIRNGKIVYFDQALDFAVVLEGLNHRGSGDFTMDIFDIITRTEIEKMMVNYDGIEYLKDKKLVADVIMNMNLTDFKFTFKENTISLNDFKMGFDGFFAMPGEDMEMDITFYAKDNTFKSLLSLVPGIYTQDFHGIDAIGSLKFDGFIKGIYSDVSSRMPSVKLELFTENASFKYPDLPESIKNIKVDFLLQSEEGDMSRTEMDLRDFHMEFGNNPVDMRMHVKNMVDYDMDASILAKIDFNNIMKMIPVEGMELSGLLDADIKINGAYDSVSNTIPAFGKFSLKDFKFSGDDLPQSFNVQSALAMVETTRIDIDHFDGGIGNSDLHLKGYVVNYVPYFMEENGILTGVMDFRSDQFDLNEWMTEEDTVEAETDSVSLEVVEVPKNLDFTLNSSIGKVLYEDLELTDLEGILIIRDGMVRMNGIRFNTLGGKFGMNGTYDTRDMEHPAFDFDMKIENLEIQKAYQSFVTIQKLAPIASIMDGSFSTDFRLSSELQSDMMPDLETMAGAGLIKIAQASVAGSKSKLVAGISGLTKFGDEKTDITLNDVLMQAEIINGRVFLEPFEVKIGQNKAIVAGSNGIDGSLDYKIKMDVPESAVKQAGSLVSSLTGQSLNLNAGNMKLNFGVAGDYNDPKVSLLGGETGGTTSQARESLKTQAAVEKEKLQKEVEEKAEEEVDKVKEEAKEVIEEQKEELKKEVDKTKKKLQKFLKGG